ncbi:MAG: S16 family serine protease, partial [Thermofilaceae archaeon]
MKALRPLVAGVLLLLLLARLAPAEAPEGYLKVVGSAWIIAPAVYQTDSGYAGSVTNITVLVTEGWGDVYISTYSLTQEDFQGAAMAAARVVSKLLNVDFSRYNFYFKVKSDSVIVGGPSAGVAMAVAVYSALTGIPVNRSVAVTGMISPDGSVGPVGGVYEKAQAVAQYGAKVFLVPP